MKAAIIEGYGGKEAVQVSEVEIPKPEANQVQVEVHAASVNPFDYKVRDGLIKAPINFPLVIGGDVSGTVSEVGENITDFKPGDTVYGQANALKQGSVAEYTVVESSQLAIKPDVDFSEAAALPLASASAYQAIYEHLKLQSGQKILIHGGGGGIGSLVIQLAKNIGAIVATTVSNKDKDYVKSLGADIVIDYRDEDFSQLIKDYDCVFDTVGGETAEKSYGVLKAGGKLVSMTADPNPDLEEQHTVEAIHEHTSTSSDKLEQITKLVNDHKLKVNIDRVFSLDEAAEALEYLKTGHPRGKVVISIKS